MIFFLYHYTKCFMNHAIITACLASTAYIIILIIIIIIWQCVKSWTKPTKVSLILSCFFCCSEHGICASRVHTCDVNPLGFFFFSTLCHSRLLHQWAELCCQCNRKVTVLIDSKHSDCAWCVCLDSSSSLTTFSASLSRGSMFSWCFLLASTLSLPLVSWLMLLCTLLNMTVSQSSCLKIYIKP